MEERIAHFAQEVLAGRVWFEVTPTEYDRDDILLSPIACSAKRVCKYILNQKPLITEDSALAGYLRLDGSVEGDIFGRAGHKAFAALIEGFYNKPYENLATLEWQHSVGDFTHILKVGIAGVREEIAASEAVHFKPEELEFLSAERQICDAIVGWAHKCAAAAVEKAEQTEDIECAKRMTRLAETLIKVPEQPAETFFEAVASLYLCYPFVPDSIGTIDRNLLPYYRADVAAGRITPQEASSLLQELYLMLQFRISIKSDRFYRGGESHFCIGGYLPDGSDGFTDFSKLVLDSMLELPTFIPQISLRWTKKTPREVLRYAMDCERKDKNKRIAFVSDEQRVMAFQNIVGVSYEDAVNYTMTGCNEPVLQGGRIMGAAQQNILRSVTDTFENRSEEIEKAGDFPEFYAVYESELFANLAETLRIDDAFNEVMARDVNLVSAIFFRGSIASAKSPTQGGATLGSPTMDLIGLPNVIDSLAIVRQFVFDEKRVSMPELVTALRENWKGYESLRTEILRKGKFFGNDDPETNEVARMLTESIDRFLSDKVNMIGRHYIVGNLIGYNEHHKFFGALTSATPDGRYAGAPTQYGIGQGEGKDRAGLTALLASVAGYAPSCRMTGPTVTNVLIDEKLVRDDESFEKLVDIFETYFRCGGIHFQLNYVSTETLLAAQKSPEQYRSLRVRVSGFSDYFNNLNTALQDEIIARTVKYN